jgi:hypothetical protein
MMVGATVQHVQEMLLPAAIASIAVLSKQFGGVEKHQFEGC